MEVFKKIIIEGKETHYSVSNMGRVRSDRYDRYLKPAHNHKDRNIAYHFVGIQVNKKQKLILVQRLVAEAFCKKPKDWTPDFEVDHWNNNRLDNRAFNLSWMTGTANKRKAHMMKHYNRYANDWITKQNKRLGKEA